MKLFITGATGYIGGSVLEAIVRAHPELEVTALQRSVSAAFSERYPHVVVVRGTFDDAEVIEQAAYEADIVIHTGDSDHEGCAFAIIAGLKKKTVPSFIIHLSGAGTIADLATNKWDGKINPKIWSDTADFDAIYNLPEDAPHHKIDRAILDASSDLLKPVIICPPDIYGPGTGVGSKTTYMVPLYVKTVLETKEAFYLGEGENTKAVIHISDLVAFFILVLEQALQGGGKVQWGREGFYFIASDEVKWKDAAVAIAKLGQEQKWLPVDSTVKSYNAEQVGALKTGALAYLSWLALLLWGSNCRVSCDRAKNLGWIPKGPSFWDALELDVYTASVQATTGTSKTDSL